MIASRLDYGCQLWSPTKISEINKIEGIQCSFTKRIDGMASLTYPRRLVELYSHHRRRDRYLSIYMWRIAEQQLSNLSPDIHFFDIINRKSRLCETKHIRPGHIGTLCYDCFRLKASRLFNCLPRTTKT